MAFVRPDCRRLFCDLCDKVAYICSWCDRGQRYCSPECRERARCRSVREAGQRYQRTPRGRRLHAQRQGRYRRRLREDPQKVTHQGCPSSRGAAIVASCSIPPPPSQVPTSRLVCFVCGSLCQPRVRHDFLRCRRR